MSPGPAHAAYPEAISAALEGARAALAREACVRDGEGVPRMVIEIARIDERGTAISAEDGVPSAQGARVAVLGRAWVEEARGVPSRHTGELRRGEFYASSEDPRVDAERWAAAARLAARRLGEALALDLVGVPQPGVDPR